MDYQTARKFLINQVTSSNQNTDTLLKRLQQRKAPVPGQLTTILLALKIIFERLQGSPNLDRKLVYSLHILAYESKQIFDAGRQSGVDWPPLLNEDINRISKAVRSIFADIWDP